MTAGQNFMNFCEDLKLLAAVTDTGAASISWASLVQQITEAIRRDAQTDYARASTLALVRLCTTGTPTFTGPVAPAIPVTHFAVSLSL